MTTTVSDNGITFASANTISIAGAMPTTGSWVAGDIILQSGVLGELAGWKRQTTGPNNVLGVDWIYFNQNPINNSAAVSDIALSVGQTAYVDFTAQTSVPLHIATGDNQLYELTIAAQGATGNAVNQSVFLLPNNSSITNMFEGMFAGQYGSTAGANSAIVNAFLLAGLGDVRSTKATVSTKTTSKWTNFTFLGYYSGGSNMYNGVGAGTWLATASTPTTVDTTTAWTSLGTISFSTAATGRAYVKRIA
jgi:hypothetical protein